VRDRLLQIHSRRAWLAVVIVAALGGVLIPLLNALPDSSPLHFPDYLVPLFGKFICFGIAALAMDLVWGYAGILSLGHALFFAMGGYGMGMYLMRSIAGEGVYRSALPDFMVFLDWKVLPWYWRGFQSFPFAMVMALAAPGLLALVFGYFAFRSRIKGVYLSIVTQALTYAAMLLFFQNATGFGGNNGLTDFKRIVGFPLQAPSTKLALYVISAITLLLVYIGCRFVVTSKLGRVLAAIRDAELKTRFCGFESTNYKVFIWTLSAVMCALAGALYVPQVGIINPSEMQPSNSIEMAIWVAVGGRGTLVGALVGAWFINGAKSWLTAAFPSAWLYVLGGLFVVVTLFLPQGLVGLWAMARRAVARTRGVGRVDREVAIKSAGLSPAAMVAAAVDGARMVTPKTASDDLAPGAESVAAPAGKASRVPHV
jgi:urea transport system permease protein